LNVQEFIGIESKLKRFGDDFLAVIREAEYAE
jgi:hypothetical protein